MKTLPHLLLILLATLPVGPLRADPSAIGVMLPELALADQHGATHRLGANARMILLAPDRNAGELIKAALLGVPQPQLDSRGVQIVFDVSAMPALVTRMFALPAMRKYGYRVLLGETSEQTAAFPRRPGAVTLIDLRENRIERIAFAAKASEIAAAIGLAPLD